MAKLLSATTVDAIEICAAASSLPFLPVKVADVSSWNTGTAVIPEFDVELFSAAACNLTSATLWGATLEPFSIADDTFDSVANATDTITASSHGLLMGGGPFRLTNVGGALPAGLSTGTDYYIHYLTANTYKLATTRENALEAVVVNITDDGTGTTTISSTSNTKRLRWYSFGLLGNAADGAISTDVQQGYTQRCRHRPRTSFYALSATLSASTVTAYVCPVVDL